MPNPLMDLIGPQRKIDKAVKGFWEEVNPTIDDYSKLLLTMLEQKEKHGKKIPI